MIITEIINPISRKNLGLTFILSAAAMAFAQQKVEISGQVMDMQNRVVPYASVTFSNATNAAFSDAILSDENGQYRVSLVPGNYNIMIEAVGYKKKSITRKISAAEKLENFVIENEDTTTPTQDIKEVVIQGESKRPYRVELDKKVYDPSQDVISKGGNLQDVLSNVPSVSVDTDGTVSMRGNSNVRFLINGKPSALLGIDSGASGLQSIPADQIDRIEVITNPSSKFEASGTAGILNIILKKQKGRGFNGSVEGSVGYLPTGRLNTNLSWRKGSWIWFMNGGVGYSERKSRRDNRNTFFDDNGDVAEQSDRFSIGESASKSYNFNPGIAVDITDKLALNLSGNFRYFDSNSDSDVNSYEQKTNMPLISSLRASDGNSDNTALQGDLGLDYKIDDEGQQITGSISLQRNSGNDLSNIVETENDIFLTRDYLDLSSISNTLIGKIDYELPLGENSKLEAGYRLDRNRNDYDNNVFGSEISATAPLDANDLLSSDVLYNETFNAFYTQFKSKINKFGYQVGLRTEISDIFIDSRNLAGTSFTTQKNYTGLFPSIFLSYDIGENKNQLLLNYSRRINRPRSWFLIPFSTFSLTDDRNRFYGNPDLNPEYVNSFELGYAIQKKKLTFNPTLYYRKSTDETQFVRYAGLDENNQLISISQPFNIGSEWQYGLDLNFSYDLYSWWKILGNLDLFGYGSDGDFFDPNLVSEPISYEGSGFAAGSRLTNTFKVDKTFSMQLQGFYRGGEKTAASDRDAIYSINFGATKTVLKGDGTIAFNIQDIFNTRARRFTSYSPNLISSGYMQFNPRQFTLSFTYRFKQGEKVEQPKKKRDPNSNYGGGDDEGPM